VRVSWRGGGVCAVLYVWFIRILGGYSILFVLDILRHGIIALCASSCLQGCLLFFRQAAMRGC